VSLPPKNPGWFFGVSASGCQPSWYSRGITEAATGWTNECTEKGTRGQTT